jgi:hypothetical protein
MYLRVSQNVGILEQLRNWLLLKNGLASTNVVKLLIYNDNPVNTYFC